MQLAEHRRVGSALAVRLPMRFADVAVLVGSVGHLHAAAEVPVHGVTGQTALAVYLRKNLRILCGLGAGSHDAAVGQLHGRFRGRSFPPVRSPCVPRCPSGQAASRCRSTLLQISAPSGAARWMQFDVSAACSSDGLFVLEYLEWKSLP